MAAVIFISALCWPMMTLAQSPWTIEKFDGDIVVNADGHLDVSETITARFDDEKHGIIRQIPTVYRDDLGSRVSIGIDVKSVLQDGAPATFTNIPSWGYQVLQIGDGDILLSGVHTYRIEYAVERAILFLADRDEIYWNVTGTDWDAPIIESSAVVTLPDGAVTIATACYQGAFGSTEACAAVNNELAGKIAFVGQGPLTIAVGLQKGVIAAPTALDDLVRFLLDNWLVVPPLLILLAVAWFWWVRGRDPRVGTIIAEYEPPNGLSAVSAGFLHAGIFTRQLFTAMIVELGSTGYLSITEQETKGLLGITSRDYTIKKEKLSAGLDDAHLRLYDLLFVGGVDELKVSSLKTRLHQGDLDAIRLAVRKKLVDDGYYVQNSFTRKIAIIALGGLLIFAGFFSATLFNWLPTVVCVICGVIVMIFGWFMPQLTERGAELLRQVSGFALFMHTAERYRSAWQEKEGIFAQYLPYAVAFNDVKHWAKVFESMGQNVSPAWYHGTQPFMNSMSFVNSFDSMSKSFATATAPASSGGSSGGGSSGGGFGGGGGSSW